MAEKNYVKVGGQLQNIVGDGILAYSKEIKDEVREKTQEQINTETYEKVAEIDEALSSLSPEQGEALALSERVGQLEKEVGYYECSTSGGTATKQVVADGYALSSGCSIKVKMLNKNTAASNIMLKIGSSEAKPLYYAGKPVSASNTWDAGEVLDVYYNTNDGGAYYANNVEGGSADGVFDVSDYNKSGDPLAPTKYIDLAAALGTDGSNIPENYRRGGMLIKFIELESLEYKQYRYMGTAVSGTSFTDTANWQGTDSVPTEDSRNLVESGGVYEECVEAGDPIGDPVGDWVPSEAEAYVDQKVAEERDRAIARENQLLKVYETFTQSNLVVGPLPATGKVNTIYRVPGTDSYTDYMYDASDLHTPIPMATYDNAIDEIPTAGSQNLVKSGGVASEIVWDVTARNSNVTFASLSALLSNANLATLIPTAVRRGGMQIRFVLSSDNKYVQYMLTNQTWSTTESDWEKLNLEEEVSQLGSEVNEIKDAVNGRSIETITDITSLFAGAWRDDTYVGANPEKNTYGKTSSATSYKATVSYIDISAYKGKTLRIAFIQNKKEGDAQVNQGLCFYTDEDVSTVIAGVRFPLGEMGFYELNVEIPSTANYLRTTYIMDTQTYGDFYCKIVSTVEKGSLQDQIDEVVGNVVELQDALTIEKFAEVTPTTSQSLKYISDKDGNISEYSGYVLDCYDVQPGQIIKIVRDAVYPSTTAAFLYHLYNTNNVANLSSITSIAEQNTKLHQGDLVISITIPNGCYMLAVTARPNNNYQPIVYRRTTEIFDAEETEERIEKLEKGVNDLAVSIDGGNLYIAYLVNGVEYVYWFKECMFNNLFTFYRVGKRTTSRTIPSTEGIAQENFTEINKTVSDNIGPISIPNVGWVGGNHSYTDNDVEYQTAECISYDIYVDGLHISEDCDLFAKRVDILVVNNLYCPPVPSTGTILTTLIATETVRYSVQKNNIFVSDRIKFEDSFQDNPILYYGMQSMFVRENKIVMPNGLYPDWHSLSNGEEITFIKGDYPNFQRFVEYNSEDGTYQSTYLIPSKNGAHDLLASNENVFKRSNLNKAYHYILASAQEEKTLVWSGIYTFFVQPLYEDANVFAYMGIVNGKDAVFIHTKTSSVVDVNITIPMAFTGRKIDEVERDSSITTPNEFVDVEGVRIHGTGIGSFIFTI